MQNAELRLEIKNKYQGLPGEEFIDDRMMDRVVDQLNAIYISKGLEAAKEMGEYVLEEFFAGDLNAFHTRGRKHMSFRRLAGKQKLLASYTYIYNSVALVEQLRMLPENIGNALSISHHRALFTVADLGTKQELAKRTVERKMTVRMLNKEIKKCSNGRERKSKAGRPPLPGCVKEFRKIIRAIDAIDVGEFDEGVINRYPPEAARQLIDEMDDKLHQLRSYRDELLVRMQAVEFGG